MIGLASAIQVARRCGLASAGIFSAYRPPIFGIGGFIDKFNSLHTYGLAVDMAGIGGPGTPEAQLWHKIAADHGAICPYGPHHPVEWNHCQPTQIKMIAVGNPLRDTVTAKGPLDLVDMFEAGSSLIQGKVEKIVTSTEELSAHLMVPRHQTNATPATQSKPASAIKSLRRQKSSRPGASRSRALPSGARR